MASLGHDIKARLREYPDFPETGVVFQDLSSVFGDPVLMRRVAVAMATAFSGDFSHVVAVEARGFLIGSYLSQATALPLVLARKAGKLPGPVDRVEYGLEYGKAALEVQQGRLGPGDRALVVDDVLATGGTLAAATELVMAAEAQVAGYAVVLRIAGLEQVRLADVPVFEILATDPVS
jgi:adenine phosphoribosyltransferase